ncbi:MAG: hypothetical protein K5931_01440, partial [Lachnospiraceae bacterium]|nr:hypothetical protein [Lachnospiraceae bacterium]
MQDIDNNNENTENKEEGYEFIQETIKKRPYNVKRGIIRILFTVIMAVVFGAVAALAFVIFEPMLSKRFSPDTETA